MSSFWHKIRADFPILKKSVYLDHASGGPIPRPVYEKITQYYEELSCEADFAWNKWIDRREDIRRKAARFIHAEPEEVTFISSASQGMNWIAELLANQGEVLTNTCEFPSSTLPWIWRKSKIVWQKPENEKVELRTLKSLLSPSVKTIVTSFVQYATGFRQDIKALGEIKGGRYLVVNATQGLGALEADVKEWNADFLCSNSYKWLMAGYGSGILYIREKWLPVFQPGSAGWRSMKEPERMDNQRLALKDDASRYEMGCPPFAAIFALGAAIDYLSSIGIQKIQRRILELTDFLILGLEKQGLEVISPRAPGRRSGIVVFKVREPEKVRRFLLRGSRKIYVSARGAGIRVAPHFYNSFEDIEILLKALAKTSDRLGSLL